MAGLFRSRTDCGGFVGFSDVASMDWEWAVVWGVNVTANFLAYILAKFAIKVRGELHYGHEPRISDAIESKTPAQMLFFKNS